MSHLKQIRKEPIMATTKTTKFNARNATLAEYNRELKRIASRKCRAEKPEDKARYEAEYKKLAEAKAKKFSNAKQKTYLTYTKAEIAELSLENTIKGIKSLQSTRCLYPERKAEVLKQEQLFQAHRQELMELAQFEALKAKLGK